MNPTRSARPPEKFALENFTVSAAKFAEEFYSFRRRKTISGVFSDHSKPIILCRSQGSLSVSPGLVKSAEVLPGSAAAGNLISAQSQVVLLGPHS